MSDGGGDAPQTARSQAVRSQTARPLATPPSTPLPTRPLGATGLQVTPLCFGTAPLGDMVDTFGYRVGADQAHATVAAILDSEVNFLDTAAFYGFGTSERRIGAVIAERGGLPDGFVLATKVDLDHDTWDFSASQVRRSLEASLQRLHLDRLPLAYLHDPYRISIEEGTGPGGALEGLVAARDEGLVEHIGLAEGKPQVARGYLSTGAFEAMITHNRWTLVDRSAEPAIDDAVQRGVGVSNAAAFGGGILVRGVEATRGRYAYHEADAIVLDRIRAMERACDDHGVPLPAAALRFSLRDARITSTIVGVGHPAEVASAVAWARTDVPDALWDELDELLPPADHWQGDR